ncbi:MAG: hypothetical protein ACOYMN_08015 [Roseimicrobium sp.]
MKLPRTITYLFIAVALSALVSCSSVTTTQPVGDTPLKLNNKTWDGAWLGTDGGVLYTRVKDERRGLLEVVWVEEKNDELKLVKLQVFLRQARSAKWIWASVDISQQEEDKAKRNNPPNYHFLVVTHPTDGRLIYWLANVTAFGEAVEDGLLKGKIMKDKNSIEVVLDPLRDEDLRNMERGGMPDVALWNEPKIFIKLNLKP